MAAPEPTVEIRRAGVADVDAVLSAGHLFDEEPRREWTERFLARDGHHLLLAYVDGVPAGFVSGVEILHPDKEVEVLLYELGVDEAFRGRGIGRALTVALVGHARSTRARGVWVPVEPGNDAAVATYRAAGAAEPEAAIILGWDLAR